ncbi:MAG: diguanylate cyclase [Deltaproteobacteria bacterium]|nr:diguanylate cyclase [Deltaproteobacteria bacterium]
MSVAGTQPGNGGVAAAARGGRYSRQVESLMEVFLGLAILVVINVVWFPEDPGYLTVSPHPFLFLTILMASRYGTFDGFVTGVMCAGIYVTYAWWGRETGTVVSAFEWTQIIPAYMFVLLGVLLGEIRAMATREVDSARAEAAVATERLDAVRRDNELLTRVKEELQGRVLSAEDPLARFYESARRLSTLRPDEAYPSLLDLVARFTGAEKFGIYVADPDAEPLPGRKAVRTFKLKAQRGWLSPDEFDAVLTAEHPAVDRVLRTREVVTARDAGPMTHDVLACAAMPDPTDDSVIGLVVIQRIPFVRLTQMTVTHLFTIAGWAGKTIADARRFEGAMDARVDDERAGVFNHRFMCERLDQEAARVRRYGGVSSYMLVRLIDFETLSDEDRGTVLRQTGEVFRKQLRNVDVVGIYRIPGVFAFILPQTNANQSVVVSARVNEAFRRALGGYGSRFAHIRLKTGVATTTNTEPKTAQQVMDEAERFELASRGEGS